jgi:uncharacterized protein (DUF305 family)
MMRLTLHGKFALRAAIGVGLALAAVLGLASCAATADVGTDDGRGHDAHATSDAEASGEAGQADIMFAQMMIPHHEQALEMSGIVLAKEGLDPEIAALADDIAAAQGPEIEQLEGWLDDWGAPREMSGDMQSMEGMLSDAQLDELEAADAASGSRLFLEQMIEHHEGAIGMAEDHLENGAHEGALALSESIIESQTAEIEQMRELLAG